MLKYTCFSIFKMSFNITVLTNNASYTFKTERSRILCNREKINLDLNKISENKNDILNIYKELLKSGKDKNYARIKACVFNASYTECSFSPAIEIMDEIVLYLSNCYQLPKLTKNLRIIITDEEIYTFGSKNCYNFHSYSSLISYDFFKLFETLIRDNLN